MNKEFFTTREVAEKYSICINTLEQWRHSSKNGSNKGPKWRKLEGTVRYHISDLEEWEKSHNPEPKRKRGRPKKKK